jgi:hypothetical protein
VEEIEGRGRWGGGREQGVCEVSSNQTTTRILMTRKRARRGMRKVSLYSAYMHIKSTRKYILATT